MLGLPKGSLEESTTALFAKAGYKIQISSRSLYPVIDDPEIDCMLLRAQEMAMFVEEGMLDCGLTGYDWIKEHNADVVEVCELVYGKVGRNPLRWVLAVPEDSPITCVEDLQGKRISTEAVGMTKNYLAEHGVTARVDFSWGATEVKPPRFADAIVEITETGSSLRANHLKIIDTVCTTTTRFIANKAAMEDPFKAAKIKHIALLLKAVLEAEGKVALMLNVQEKDLKNILESLPALHRPTVSRLSEPGWYALNTIVDEKLVRDLIPALKELNATGIVEYPLNKLIP